MCNNIYKICQSTAPVCMVGLLAVDNPLVLIWASTAISFINLSQVPSYLLLSTLELSDTTIYEP